MLNKVIITGRLTAAPELKTTPSGQKVTSFTVAVQRNYKDSSGAYPTDFINIVAWRNTAEFISNYFSKGELIAIVGSLQTRKYEDKNGNKRIIAEVVAEEAQFVESKKDKENTNAGFNAPSANGGNNTDFEEVTDEELPF